MERFKIDSVFFLKRLAKFRPHTLLSRQVFEMLSTNPRTTLYWDSTGCQFLANESFICRNFWCWNSEVMFDSWRQNQTPSDTPTRFAARHTDTKQDNAAPASLQSSYLDKVTHPSVIILVSNASDWRVVAWPDRNSDFALFELTLLKSFSHQGNAKDSEIAVVQYYIHKC